MTGVPEECFNYRLGNRSALEWVIDQYQVSVETVRLVGELERGVGVEELVLEEKRDEVV